MAYSKNPRSATGMPSKPQNRSRGLINTDLANNMLEKLIDEIRSGNIVKTMGRVEFIKDPNDDRPCWKWTLKNRIFMIMQGTYDARTVAEWKSVGRWINRGSSAIYIIKPRIVYTCVACSNRLKRRIRISYNTRNSYECEECGACYASREINGVTESIISKRLVGYGCQPEFRMEDTHGRTLPEYKPVQKVPLEDIISKWNIQIRYQRDPSGKSLGSFQPETKIMHLGTEDPGVFFHEISHAADGILLKKEGKALIGGQDPMQEAVAQLASCVLSEMYGVRSNKGETMEYIQKYAGNGTRDDVVKLAVSVLDRAGAVIRLILDNTTTKPQIS